MLPRTLAHGNSKNEMRKSLKRQAEKVNMETKVQGHEITKSFHADANNIKVANYS